MRVRLDPLDKLVSEYVRKRSGGYCERCGAYFGWKGLQACHFHSRRKRCVRWDADNLVALDFGCHIYLDGNPLEKVEWFKQHLGEERFDLLTATASTTYPKPDKKLLTLYFQQKLSEME